MNCPSLTKGSLLPFLARKAYRVALVSRVGSYRLDIALTLF